MPEVGLAAAPFHHGLVIVFTLAIAMSVVAALASLLRGSRYIHDDSGGTSEPSRAALSAT